MVSPAEANIEDVTPEAEEPVRAARGRKGADAPADGALSPEWRPRPDEVFAPNDTSMRAILGRALQNWERGNPDFDPLTNQRVWWKPNGRGGHVAVLRPVADFQKATETGLFDYWSVERGCWVRNGVKAEADEHAFRTDNIGEF